MTLNILDFGMNIQQAIEVPRFYNHANGNLQIENRIPQDVKKALEAKGHKVTMMGDWAPTNVDR